MMPVKKPKYIEGITLPTQVQIEAIVAMKNLLKTHSMDWAKDLSERMYPQTDAQKKKDPQNEKGTSRIYNIVANQIKDNGARVKFITKGKELLDEYRERQQEVDKIIEQEQLLSE